MRKMFKVNLIKTAVVTFIMFHCLGCSNLTASKINSCEVKEINYKGQVVDINKVGIGASIQQDNSLFFISHIVPHGPVEQHGSIALGDIILAISPNNVDKFINVSSMTLVEVINTIRGCKNSQLALMLERNGKTFFVKLRRDSVNL